MSVQQISLQITKISRNVNQSHLEDHVKRVLKCRIISSSFVRNKQKRINSVFVVETTLQAKEAARLLRSVTFQNIDLHVEIITSSKVKTSTVSLPLTSFRITRLPGDLDQSQLEEHVRSVLNARIISSTYTLNKKKRTEALVSVQAPTQGHVAACLLRSLPFQGTKLEVQISQLQGTKLKVPITPSSRIQTKAVTITTFQISRLQENLDRAQLEDHVKRIVNGRILSSTYTLSSRKAPKALISVETSLQEKEAACQLRLVPFNGKKLSIQIVSPSTLETSAATTIETQISTLSADLVAKLQLDGHEKHMQNKHSVVVSEGMGLPELVPVRGTAHATFVIIPSDTSTKLKSVVVSGNNKKAFTLQSTDIPQDLTEECQIRVLFTSTGVGVYKCVIRMDFDCPASTFFIERHLQVRSGDATLVDILKPKAPYRRRPKRRQQSSVEVVPAPPSESDHEVNPFSKLPHFRIPAEFAQLIRTGELRIAMKKPDLNIEGYLKFWKSILWASEFQAYEDIKSFDMDNVQLKREGRFIVLHVPGLAEGRPSVLRGDLVNITWKNRKYQGRVHQIRLLDLLIELDGSFHRTFNNDLDTVDVRFTFSRMAFRTSHKGCDKAASDMGAGMLVPRPMSNSACRSVLSTLPWANRNINEEQKAAVISIVEGRRRPLPYVIFGPPGTGKTTALAEAVYQLVRHQDDLKVLLVAPSNDAADVLVTRLAPYFPPTEMRRILAYTRSIDQVSPSARPYAMEGYSNSELVAAIARVRIVISTVNFAARLSYFGVPKGHFDVLCVDEAGQATEPELVAVASTLIDFQRMDSRVGQLVLAGDPKQLGPVISSLICREFGAGVSYMERLAATELYGRGDDNCFPQDLLTKLIRNYRCHPAILKLPNELFYDNELMVCGDPMVINNMSKWEHLVERDFPVLFHAVHGENLRESNSPSWFNPQEAQEVVNYVDLLVNQSRPAVSVDDIGIITCYNRQAQKIRLALKARKFRDIKVGSVESFQGQERRCIIISTVRSDPEYVQWDLKHNLGFVADEKRFNVALTRASAMVVVIGNPLVLAIDTENWLPLLRYCRDNNSWAGQAWEEDVNEEDVHGSVHDGGESAREEGKHETAHKDGVLAKARVFEEKSEGVAELDEDSGHLVEDDTHWDLDEESIPHVGHVNGEEDEWDLVNEDGCGYIIGEE